MDSNHTSDGPRELTNKGKGRASSPDSTERTPLLASRSYRDISPDDPESIHLARRRLRSKLTLVFLSSLLFCIITLIALASLAYSYYARASEIVPEDIIQHALVVRGPQRIDVLNITEDSGMWVNVEALVGVDAGLIIDGQPESVGFGGGLWTSIGRWGLRRLGRVSVELDEVKLVPGHDSASVLAYIRPLPIELPLTTDPPSDLSWLTQISLPVYIHPTDNTSVLIQFLRDTWMDGWVNVEATAGQVAVHGGALHESTWRRRFALTKSDVKTSIHIKIPPIPGLPTPGRHAPFPSLSELVTLQAFEVSSQNETLSLEARATIIDPAPDTFNATTPPIPFTISLPSTRDPLLPPVPVASVHTLPFTLTHPNITVLIQGGVLPLPVASSSILSEFLSTYLSAKPSPIIISTPLFPSLAVDTVFPAPNPRPRLLRDVTIHDMKVKPTGPGGTILASGTVFARVVLPKGMRVELDVNRVFPDVLIFDGEVPAYTSDSKSGIPPPSLPDPLPEGAFGHIRPEDWLVSVSVPDESKEDEGAAFAVTAKLVDIPVEILPGRQKVASAFIRKVIFESNGAIAGIQGTAAVSVYVHGLPYQNEEGQRGEMELTGLPFQGSVRVGLRSL